jgi:hypothetical protein
LLTLGIVRSNIEDYLVTINLIQTNPCLKFVDLTPEIAVLSSYYGYGDEQQTTESSTKNFSMGKQNLLTSSPIQMIVSGGNILELRAS